MNHLTKTIGLAFVLGLAVAGCNPERHEEIPQSASLVAEGSKVISYEAPRAGMIWVYNRGNGNMDYAGRVDKGDLLVVDPDHNKVTLNGRVVDNKLLSGTDDKRIFYKADDDLSPGDRRYGSGQ